MCGIILQPPLQSNSERFLLLAELRIATPDAAKTCWRLSRLQNPKIYWSCLFCLHHTEWFRNFVNISCSFWNLLTNLGHCIWTIIFCFLDNQYYNSFSTENWIMFCYPWCCQVLLHNVRGSTCYFKAKTFHILVLSFSFIHNYLIFLL